MIYDYPAIGRKLKQKRLNSNRKIDDIVEQTKISAEYIKAIEEGNTDGLPSAIYYDLFTRSYAKELGFDPEELLEEFATEETVRNRDTKTTSGESSPPEENSGKTERPPGESSPWTVGLWVAGVVVVIIIVVYLVSNYGNGDEPTMENEPSPALSIDTVTDYDESPDTGVSIAAEAVDSITDSPPEIVIPPADMPALRLEIEALQLSWIVVVADGDTVLTDNLDSGVTRSITADEEFSLTLGNPSGVALKINQHRVRNLSPSGRVVSDVRINRDNLDEYLLVEEDNQIETN